MLADLDDVESDMSAFHRVDDIYSMPAATFISRGVRLPAYKGIMRLRIEADNMNDRGTPTAPTTSKDTHVELDSAEAIASHPGFGGWVEAKRTDTGDGTRNTTP